MKTQELRELSDADLRARLAEEEQALLKLRFNRAIAGQVENPAQYSRHKRTVARVLTLLRERELAAK